MGMAHALCQHTLCYSGALGMPPFVRGMNARTVVSALRRCDTRAERRVVVHSRMLRCPVLGVCHTPRVAHGCCRNLPAHGQDLRMPQGKLFACGVRLCRVERVVRALLRVYAVCTRHRDRV